MNLCNYNVLHIKLAYFIDNLDMCQTFVESRPQPKGQNTTATDSARQKPTKKDELQQKSGKGEKKTFTMR